MRIAKLKLGYGVMVSTTDFDSVSLGSSPSSPTKLTNMEEIFKKVFKNMNLGTIFRVHPAFSMIKAFAKRDY